jgi:hypothetical protein
MGKVLPFLERSHPDDDEAIVDRDRAEELARLCPRIEDALWAERLAWVLDVARDDEDWR